MRGLGESDYVLPSHPSLVRGLKLMTLGATLWMVGNRHPTRVRGLKQTSMAWACLWRVARNTPRIGRRKERYSFDDVLFLYK